jgi:hypothetical protein
MYLRLHISQLMSLYGIRTISPYPHFTTDFDVFPPKNALVQGPQNFVNFFHSYQAPNFFPSTLVPACPFLSLVFALAHFTTDVLIWNTYYKSLSPFYHWFRRFPAKKCTCPRPPKFREFFPLVSGPQFFSIHFSPSLSVFIPGICACTFHNWCPYMEYVLYISK